jgi:hypothetical protein
MEGEIMPVLTAEEALEAGKNLDFYQVWTALMESRIRFEEMHAETERLMQKMEARVDKTSEDVDRIIKRIDKVTANVGGLNRSLGELIESLLAGRLWERFPEYGLARAYQRVLIYDENNHTKTDIDILLSNGEWAMIVEVKREFVNEEYVKHHLNRMKLVKKYPPAEVRGKKLLGAIAGAVVSPDVRDLAQKNGLFVLELNGEQVSRLESPEGFKPAVW